MPFKSGAEWNGVPNYSGRPKKTPEQYEFEKKCRSWSARHAIERLIYWADKTDDKHGMQALTALKEILNRAFGTPVAIQHVETNVTADLGKSVEELASELTALVGAAKGTGGPNAPEVKMDARA